VYTYVNRKMIPAATIPGMVEEKDGRDEFKYDIE
jgi:hypothetical protein